MRYRAPAMLPLNADPHPPAFRYLADPGWRCVWIDERKSDRSRAWSTPISHWGIEAPTYSVCFEAFTIDPVANRSPLVPLFGAAGQRLPAGAVEVFAILPPTVDDDAERNVLDRALRFMAARRKAIPPEIASPLAEVIQLRRRRRKGNAQ